MKKACNLLLGLILIVIFIFWKNMEYGNTRWGQDSISYEKARVVKVVNENIQEKYKGLKLGIQNILVHIENPKYDKNIEIQNTLATEHSIYVQQGDKVIVVADEPQGVAPHYSIYNYDRSGIFIIYFIAFIGLLYIVGKKKGIESAITLFLSFYIIFFMMIPLIYLGYSPVGVTVFTCILCSIYCVVILYGYSLMGAVNLMSMAIGFVIAAIIFYLVSLTAHLSGFNLEDVEGLLLITEETGLNVHGLLFSGVAIAAYGAAMDVSVSISSSLLEIKKHNSAISTKELFLSGMQIGKDIIGTMVDTLIFAFLGGSLPTVLIFISYGVAFNQLISSDYFAVEFVTSLIGTAVVIIMVPISSYVAGIVYNSKKFSKIKQRH